jgi:hypothetical protein
MSYITVHPATASCEPLSVVAKTVGTPPCKEPSKSESISVLSKFDG